MASHSSTSTTFGPRTTVCKQIGNLFLVPIPSRANPSVREIYNAQGKISAYEVQCRHSFTHNHWIPKGFVHLLFNFYVASVSSIRLQRSRKGRKSSGHDWRSITFPLPFILRKSGPFVTRGAFNLPWQKNLVIKFYVLHMETVWTAWGLDQMGLQTDLPYGSEERKHHKSEAIKDAFLKTADLRKRVRYSLQAGRKLLQPKGWKKGKRWVIWLT